MMTEKLQTQFVDLPEIRETFADSIGMTTFDGTQVRLELHVTRLDPPKPPEPPSGRRYPVARVVLTPQCAVELFNQLSAFVQVMKQKGMVDSAPVKRVAN